MSRWAPRLLFPLVCLALAGCGKAGVSGKVSFKGTPLTSGNVTFRAGDVVRGAAIEKDGTYRLTDCPPGDYKVTVSVPTLRFATRPPSGAVPKAADMPGKEVSTAATLPAVPIDPKYADVKTSGLSFTVAGGGHEFDIDLK
ncbi:MAG: carboxypeptidase-like regulatory domain-containing protein [Gemmataceae bacterium]